MGKPETRKQVLTFAKNEGLVIKGNSNRCGVFTHNPKNTWVDAFDDWQQAYDFFLQHGRARQFGGPRAPWEGASA